MAFLFGIICSLFMGGAVANVNPNYGVAVFFFGALLSLIAEVICHCLDNISRAIRELKK